MRKKDGFVCWFVMVMLVLGISVGNGALVAQWTFRDLNDSSTEDATNDVLSLVPGSGTAELLTAGEYSSGVLKTTSSGMAQVARSEELTFAGSSATFTIWARIKMDHDTANCNELLRNEISGGGFTFRVEDATNRPLRFRSETSSTSGLYLNDRDWHNVAIKVYMDGVQRFEFYKDGTTSRYNGTLRSNPGDTVYWLGSPSGTDLPLYVEEMRVYNTALSNEELDAIQYAPEPGTMGLLLVGLGLLRKKNAP